MFAYLLEEVQARVSLDETQAGAVAIALGEWSDRAAMKGQGKGQGQGKGNGQGQGYAKGQGSGNGQGQGQCCGRTHHSGCRGKHTGAQGKGRGGVGMHGSNRLVLNFIADVAPGLETATLADMSQFLADDRAQHVTSQESQIDPGCLARVEELGVTDAQLESLKKARKEQWDATRELRGKFLSGKISEDVMIQTATGMQTSMSARVKDILTDEQFAQWTQMRKEKGQKMAARRIDKVEQQTRQQATWLSRVVGLTVEQQSQLDNILYAKVPEKQDALRSLRDGNSSSMDTWQKMFEIRSAEKNEIKKILKKDQIERLEAVTPLMPRGRNAIR